MHFFKKNSTHLYPYVCILDFEATCDDSVKHYDNEIIEFPSVLLKWDPLIANYTKVSEIQFYCKPLCNTKVTKFCNDLTGITQDKVNQGIDFTSALEQHVSWLMQECKVDKPDEMLFEDRVIIVTCGAWDLNTVFPKDCRRWNVNNPNKVYRRFVNIKVEFANQYKRSKLRGMKQMLEELEIPLEGRHHSGIDDCRNIAKIWQRMVTDGYDPRPEVIDVPKKLYHIREQKKKYQGYKELIAKRSQERELQKK